MDSPNRRKGVVERKRPSSQSFTFGHTLGHAIEKQKAGELYHGECVSIGAAAAAYISIGRVILQRYVQTILSAFTSFKLCSV